MRIAIALLLAAAVAAGGCFSPEAARTRGGGPGADVGNRPAEVKMHEGSGQYWKTPQRIGVESPSLQSAEHARQMSRQ